MGNLVGCGVGLALAVVAAAADAPWRTYDVYQPTIERYAVNDADAQRLKYNHDSSVAWFGDRWFCLWNANEPAAEGKPGQLNYQSTSVDGRTWSAPEACFADPARSENPVPCAKGTQWQPNLIVVDGELWAVWSQNSRDEYNGAYLSRLPAPDGRWTNARILLDGKPDAVIDGRAFRIFPTQNPIRLRSGRVLAPCTLMGAVAADAPPGLERWWTLEKRDTVLYSDDLGRRWSCSPGAVQPGRTWAQWEPTVWELADGTVMMFSRNNDLRSAAQGGPRPAAMLLWSESRDQGATWSPHQPVPLETVCSRMHVLPAGGDRFVMIHNDWLAGRFVDDRRNLALFFARGGGVDFVAGPGVSGDEPAVMYPQMWVHDQALLVSYSQGVSERSIKVARVSPLPDPARFYLFPRTNLPDAPRPALVDGALRFAGGQRLTTRAPLDPGPAAFSLGLWLRHPRGGALLDSRCAGAPGGLLVGLAGSQPFVFLGTPERNLISDLRLEGQGLNYVGVSVDLASGKVLFVVNGQSETRAFSGPVPPLRAGPGVVGQPGLPGSRVPGLHAELRELAFYRDACLTVAQHHRQANRLAATLGHAPFAPATDAPPATILLDPGDPELLAAAFVLPDDVGPGAVEVVSEDGRQLLRFRGEASAGIDLDANRRADGDGVALALRVRIESGPQHVVLTLGDANHPARLVHDRGDLLLTAGTQRCALGPVAPGRWVSVSVRSARHETSASLEGGAAATVEHEPVATWAYLGQGYRDGSIPAANRFAVDVGALRSRVSRP